jgi:signal transduction histidine kinase
LEFECRIHRAGDGAERWIWVRGAPQLDADGRVVRLAGVVADVTEAKSADAAREQAVTALAESEARIIEVERYARRHAESARRATDRAAARMAQLQQLTAALAATHDEADAARIIVAEVRQATGAATGSLMLRRPRETEGAQVERGPGGRFVHWLIGDGDLLDLVRQEGFRDGIEPPATHFTITTPIPTATCVRTGEPVFLDGQEEIVRTYPAMADVARQQPIHAVASIPLEVGGRVVGAMTYTFAEPRRFAREDRELFVALARQAAQALERTWLADAERRARHAAELALAEAEQANAAKSQFLAATSHELRTPLNAIGGYAQLMEMELYGPTTPEQRDALARVTRAQQQLLALINDILHFAKLEAGETLLDLADVPVHEVARQVEELLAPQLRQKGIAYDFSGACDPAIVAHADRDRLRQILVNLVGNAGKYTDAGGALWLSAASAGGQVCVDVRDTGRGIPAEKLEAIFEPFVQLHGSYTAQQGVGLGLAISRDLARRMGGDVTVRSEVGAGSWFTVVLPGAAAPEVR